MGKNNTINAPQTEAWDSALILSNNTQQIEKQLEASQIKRNPWNSCDVFQPADRSQLNMLQSSHNHHRQSGKMGQDATVQRKTSQVEKTKKKNKL